MNKGKEWLKNEMLNLRHNHNRVMLVTIGEVMELIYQLDEPDKIVIPQFVADWWEGDSVTMYGGESINKKYKLRLISEFHDRGLDDHLSKVEDWLDENVSTVLDLINGKPYEIAKETLYYIKLSNNQYAQWYDADEQDLMLVNSEAFAGLFTEREIKAINPYLMALVVEV